MANESNEHVGQQDNLGQNKDGSTNSWRSPKALAVIITAIAGIITACGTILVPMYIAYKNPTPTISLPTGLIDTSTFTPLPVFKDTATPTDTIIPTFTLTSSPTFTLTPTFTSTNTATYTPSYTPTKTSTPSPKSISLNGKFLSMNLPSFATLPDVRGSITFNTNVEIAQTKKITVRLDVRNESGTQWAHSNSILLYQLSSGEKFCSITPAAYNSANYWLGYQTHCKSTDACSVDVEGNSKLLVTIGKVYIIIAPAGSKCP